MTKDRAIRTVAGIIAIGLLMMVAAVSFAVFYIAIPKGSETIVGQLVGTLLSLLGVVVAFYYGSSESSKMKDQLTKTQADTIQAAQAALPAIEGSAPSIPVGPGETVVVKGEEAS